MLARPHESEEYQDFLISEQRKGIVSPDLYNSLITEFRPGMNILDFGCGLGYVSVFYSDKFLEHDNFHIYSCDYQVDILDMLWKRIADNKFRNITPFFMPDQSRLHFPNWIPVMDFIFMSFSLSATDNPVDILKTIQTKCSPNTILHIIDWDKEKNNDKIEALIPAKKRIGQQDVRAYLTRTGMDVIREFKTGGPYFVLSCRLKKT